MQHLHILSRAWPYKNYVMETPSTKQSWLARKVSSAGSMPPPVAILKPRRMGLTGSRRLRRAETPRLTGLVSLQQTEAAVLDFRKFWARFCIATC